MNVENTVDVKKIRPMFLCLHLCTTNSKLSGKRKNFIATDKQQKTKNELLFGKKCCTFQISPYSIIIFQGKITKENSTEIEALLDLYDKSEKHKKTVELSLLSICKLLLGLHMFMFLFSGNT